MGLANLVGGGGWGENHNSFTKRRFPPGWGTRSSFISWTNVIFESIDAFLMGGGPGNGSLSKSVAPVFSGGKERHFLVKGENGLPKQKQLLL